MEPTQNLNQSANHPTEEELSAFWNPAVGADALERLAVHLDSCSACRARLERMEPALSEFSRCLDAVHAQVPWERYAEFEVPAERLESTPKPRRSLSWPFAWAGGIAAVAVGCIVLFTWIGRSADRRAEALLAQASSVPAQNPLHHRLRIRTQTALFVRSVPEQKEVSLVRARFDQANYDWRDPLSAQSYSAWRHALKHKTSKVSAPVGAGPTSQPQLQIETATEEGTLRTASLTFDAKLAPVSGLFQFSDQEWVEITAMPDLDQASADLVPAAISAPSASGTSENVPREPLAERELDVRLAINVLHTGASEPIEVSSGSGDILVTTYHLTADQEKKLALSLKPISGVTLRALDQNAEQKQPGARFADRTGLLLQTSQDLSFEAHFLAELADRFAPSVEATLRESAQRKLWDLRVSHVREMNRTLAGLQQMLQEASPEFHSASGDQASQPTAPGAQELSHDLADSASVLDRLIILHYATGESASERAAIWPQVSVEFVRLRTLEVNYARMVEEGRHARE
jgi:hypothetical protein